MLYAAVKRPLLALLKAPSGPPDPPAGTHASVQVFRASPRFLVYRLLGAGIVALLVATLVAALVLAAVAQREQQLLGVAGLIAVVALPGFLITWIVVRVDYDLRYYVVTDRSLRVREGAWSVREMTITYANVQNLRVVQGPLMRILGIWTLRVDVAGGGGKAREPHAEGGHHVSVAGIDDAHALRDLILGYLRSARAGAGLGDLDDEADGAARSRPAGALSPAALVALERLAAASAALAATARARHP
jgi:membrane protein YdbS with pleckstrin-like domain